MHRRSMNHSFSQRYIIYFTIHQLVTRIYYSRARDAEKLFQIYVPFHRGNFSIRMPYRVFTPQFSSFPSTYLPPT